MAPPRATGRQRSSLLSDTETIDRYKEEAARRAASLVSDGMRVGLGTGSTVAHLLPALAQRELAGMRWVASSPATARAARALGLRIDRLDDVGELDIAIDGADQVDPRGWLIKGGGGAHTREKIIAAAAHRFVVIVSAEKAVDRLAAPVPLELLRFGVQTTLRALGDARLRPGPGEERVRVSPDGGLIADYLGPIDDPHNLASRLSETPGVLEHGLFPPAMVSLVLIGGEDGVEQRRGAKHPNHPASSRRPAPSDRRPR